MKRILSILILAVALSATAQTPRQLMQQGNDAYAKSDFAEAVRLYNTVLDAGYQSADLYYNLGNAHFRMEDYGLAILNYERALRLKPNFRDARQNLDLANSKTEDEIAALPEIFIVHWAHSIVTWFSPTGWRILLLCLLALLGDLTVFFVLSSQYSSRKGALIGISVTAVLLLLCLACTIASSVRYNRHNQAIVTSPMAVVKSSPEDKSVDKLILHEGTKVNIEETLGSWHKIQIADGNSGWMNQSDITVI